MQFLKQSIRSILITILALFIWSDDVFAQCPSDCTGTNTFLGDDSGMLNTTGDRNSFFGFESGRDNMTGSGNSFFGFESGLDNTSGFNSFFGASSGNNNRNGNNNSFFGAFSGHSNISGLSNSFFGRDAGRDNRSGNFNSFFGRDAGLLNESGGSNSFFGRDAGQNNMTGSYNVAIGRGAGPTLANADVSHRLYIDSDTSPISSIGNDDPLIYGEFDNDFVRINGTFEVTAGLTNPSSIKLKDQFAAVSSAFVLDKINELDIAEWSYKHDPDVRHIGPTAESFYEAFGLGTGGDNISTIDADGVSLIAIQALTQEIADQQEQLTKKDQEIKNLEERLLRIEQLLLSDKNE